MKIFINGCCCCAAAAAVVVVVAAAVFAVCAGGHLSAGPDGHLRGLPFAAGGPYGVCHHRLGVR